MARSETEAPTCAYARACGACQHINQPYAQELTDKQRFVTCLFGEAGLVTRSQLSQVMQPIKGMADPYYYRDKVISPFAPGRKMAAPGRAPAKKGSSKEQGRDGRRSKQARREILTGMYAPHSHRLVRTDGCLVENAQANAVIVAVRQLMGKFDIPPYNEDTNEGFMRHAVVRVGHHSGEVLVTLVTNGEEFPASRAFCRELKKRCPFITSVVQNVNTRQTNVILGQRETRLYGPGFILDELCGLTFRISSQSFYQVNAVQTEVLYDTAIGLAGLDGTQDVIDAYCGTGTIGLVAASRGARSVTGVDQVDSAIRDARKNARHNGIENARFCTGDAGAFMRQIAADRADAVSSASGAAAEAGEAGALVPLVVFMDPPRAGSTPQFLDALCALAPQRVVYISCNPKTQVRDAAYLAERGYVVKTVVPVDMFPHTEHIETVALLTRE